MQMFSRSPTTVLAAVALELGHNEATVTALVTCQSIASLVGCCVLPAPTQ